MFAKRVLFSKEFYLAVSKSECGGSHFYCPEGSSESNLVTAGRYTTGNTSVPNKDYSKDDESIRFAEM